MKYKGIFLAVLLGGLTGLAGCRKDLCYDHDKHALTANVLLQPEWEKEWERDYGKGWSDNWPQEHGMEYDELRRDCFFCVPPGRFAFRTPSSGSWRGIADDGRRKVAPFAQRRYALHRF